MLILELFFTGGGGNAMAQKWSIARVSPCFRRCLLELGGNAVLDAVGVKGVHDEVEVDLRAGQRAAGCLPRRRARGPRGRGTKQSS